MKKHGMGMGFLCLMFVGTASGAWSETFTGGLDRSDWIWTAMNGGSFAMSTSGDYLRVTTNQYPPQFPMGANQIVGLIPETYSQCTLSAWFNVNATQYDPGNPISYNDTGMAMIARGDLNLRNAYLLFFDRGLGEFRLAMAEEYVVSYPFEQRFHVANANVPYFVTWTLNGPSLTADIYDADLNWLSTLSGYDTTFSSGWCGVMAYLNPNVSPDSPLYPYPSLINGTFDDISVVPEPASLALLTLGGLSVWGRRRGRRG